MILLIDNYDSFVHNLARYLRRLGGETLVLRHDALDVPAVRRLAPRAIVLSPGPCTPQEAGCSLEVVRQLAGEIPLLGVCLGHQTIGAALGADVVRAPEPWHGRSSAIRHTGTGLFAGLPQPLTVGRYHSLVISPPSLPDELVPTAWTDDGVLMAVAHRVWPVFGVQFHPESILTDCGFALLANFLRLAGLPAAVPPTSSSERPAPPPPWPAPHSPVTF